METVVDNALDCTYMFITDAEHKQWRILLERRSTGFTWGAENAPKIKEEEEEEQPRSRFAGLRNMSVASLASLKQKLSEGRKMLENRKTSSETVDPVCSSNMSLPEPLNKKVGGTRLFAFKDQVLGGLFPDTAILTFHNTELEVLPQVAFRLPRLSESVLVLDKLMLVASGSNDFRVVSAHHAEIHLDTAKTREEPVLQAFVMTEKEKILGFKHGYSPEDCQSLTEDGLSADSKDAFITNISKRVKEAKRKGTSMFRNCFVITSLGVYVLRLDRDPVTTFLESATQGDIRSAEKVAATFDLDARSLLELAADIRLSECDFAGAIALYRLSGCKHLKAVLKFAASGHTHQLLSYLSVLFKTPNLDVSPSDRIHLSNLTLMAYFQQILEVEDKDDLRSRIQIFLRDNSSIDESLAIRLSVETREWSLLLDFCHRRGLHCAMVDAICSLLEASKPNYYSKDFKSEAMSKMSASERRGLLSCLLTPDNLSSCLIQPNLAEDLMQILRGSFPFLNLHQLQSVLELCQPINPAFLPLIGPVLSDSKDCSLASKLLEFYLTTELNLIKKEGLKFNRDLVHLAEKSVIKEMDTDTLITGPLLATGPTHAMLSRPKSGALYSWGFNHHGVLAHHGVSVVSSRFCSPKRVEFFHKLPQTTVLSVSCGKCHSVALTSAGVYIWGSSKYGQLGLGKDRVSAKQPEVIPRFASKTIVSVVAGHYHSVALDSHGRVWTWGWGVHGQLGLGDIEDEHTPKRVMLKDSIHSIAAGHAHTMVSTVAGHVWVFGCGLFGQLGNGNNKKSTVPLKVDFNGAIDGCGVVDEKIGMIRCGYFHNIAMSQDGQRLYTWGCNPQLLRLEAQQKKKEMLREHFKREDDSEEPKESKEHEMLHLIPSLMDTSMIEGDIVSFSCGNQHSMILTSNGTVYTFGRNVDGQLGIGSRREAKVPNLVTALKDDSIVLISCGGDYSMALSERGTLFAWGNNASGQLGKPPLEDVNAKAPNTKLVVLNKARKAVLQHSLQNSCDVPKPVSGLNEGKVYSEEDYDLESLKERFSTSIASLDRANKTLKQLQKTTRSEASLHLTIELFHRFIDQKTILKQCLVTENLQAAAKVSLLCASNVIQAFEFTLQSIVKQSQGVDQPKLVFEAYNFYLRFDTDKRQLTERLIACWQDLKFSFLLLEKLTIKESNPVMLQILVLTLFCPNEERDMETAPVLDNGPKLVDLFTPEFCLKIGDTFVNTLKAEESDQTKCQVAGWLHRQRSRTVLENHDEDRVSNNLNQLVTGLLTAEEASDDS